MQDWAKKRKKKSHRTLNGGSNLPYNPQTGLVKKENWNIKTAD